ncbi:MAG: heavy metal translocating P-type ATPase [Bauldia sp.]
MHCGGCLGTVERALTGIAGVTKARANLTTRRVAIDALPAVATDALIAALAAAGYAARTVEPEVLAAVESDKEGSDLLRAMAIAGFAAGNVMLLSVSVWGGAEPATRDLFHWVSALIALPAVALAGQPFFRSAFRALAARRFNMDVPIAIGVTLATAMSLYETMVGGEHAYFDASVTLLFFLLLGRYLDHRMRSVARSAAARLVALSPRTAARLSADGTVANVPIAEVGPGDRLRVLPGDRIPIDGIVDDGRSDVDRSMLTGEADPEPVHPGIEVFAGTLNLTGPMIVTARRRATQTVLAEVVRLTAAAERGGGRFVRLADRASRLYAPAVHLLALTTFVSWLALGSGWHASLTAAIAVLIITCPCALGLAVPAVQVVASGLLLRRGVMLKDGSALERLALIDTVVFDKTGTLSEGEARLVDATASGDAWSVAAALASASRHPLARALARDAIRRSVSCAVATDIVEHPGAGVEGEWAGTRVRLGRRDWVGAGAAERPVGPELWLRIGDAAPVRFGFVDSLRRDAAATVSALRRAGLAVHLLSGDTEFPVAAAAATAGISDWHADCRPADKARYLSRLAESGRRVLMVGDGINDAPALATAFVSMSPANAADISQAAADIVFAGADLAAIPLAHATALRGRRVILQNFALAIGYNIFAVPLAMTGVLTPLIAAVAMSTSSIIVTANALRLAWQGPADRSSTVAAAPGREALAAS